MSSLIVGRYKHVEMSEYHIAVSQKQYDAIIKRLDKLQREPRFIMHDFEGDDFQTKIWRQDGKLMAEDPKSGVRQISVMDYKDGQYVLDGQVMRGRTELNPASAKAKIMEQLLQDGMPFDKANQIAVVLALRIQSEKSGSGCNNTA